LPTDHPEARLFAADIIGYLVGCANLTNTRSLALLGDPDASTYELLFSFSSPGEKNEFLNLVRSNEDMGKDYISEFTPPGRKGRMSGEFCTLPGRFWKIIFNFSFFASPLLIAASLDRL